MAIYEVEDPGFGRNVAMLGPKALDDLSEFLVELENVKTSDGCSTSIHCIAKTKEVSINKSSIDCYWAGFQELKQSLFIDSNN